MKSSYGNKIKQKHHITKYGQVCVHIAIVKKTKQVNVVILSLIACINTRYYSSLY